MESLQRIINQINSNKMLDTLRVEKEDFFKNLNIGLQNLSNTQDFINMFDNINIYPDDVISLNNQKIERKVNLSDIINILKFTNNHIQQLKIEINDLDFHSHEIHRDFIKILNQSNISNINLRFKFSTENAKALAEIISQCGHKIKFHLTIEFKKIKIKPFNISAIREFFEAIKNSNNSCIVEEISLFDCQFSLQHLVHINNHANDFSSIFSELHIGCITFNNIPPQIIESVLSNCLKKYLKFNVLNIHNCDLSPLNFNFQFYENLSTLNLESCKINDEIFDKIIANIINIPNIKYISFANNNLTDGSAKLIMDYLNELAEIRECEISFNICGNQITDELKKTVDFVNKKNMFLREKNLFKESLNNFHQKLLTVHALQIATEIDEIITSLNTINSIQNINKPQVLAVFERLERLENQLDPATQPI